MKDETREELERIEKELLAQETQEEDILDDELIRDVLAEPAFEDMDEIKDPDEPMVYCNYSNGYGRGLEKNTEPETKAKMSKSDKVDMGLMIASSVLALGIIILMIYWLVNYL